MDPLQQVPLDVHSDRNEMPPPLEAPGLLRVLIGMDKQAEGKKSQQAVPARIRGQPPAKQTPGQQRDKHTNQPVGTPVSNVIYSFFGSGLTNLIDQK